MGASPTPQLPERLKRHKYELRQIQGIWCIIPPVRQIPAGEFVMGSDMQLDPESGEDEQPLHGQQLTGYWLGQFPVTVAEYQLFVRAGNAPPTTAGAPQQLTSWDQQQQHPDHPVVCVQWYEALAYARWLSSLLQQTWRLPTEAEWEKAARAGDRRIYPWGNAFDPQRCNTDERMPLKTTPIDHYPTGVNPYDLWDMAGNVWEWTSSIYFRYPYVHDDGREEAASRAARVLRGGAWKLTEVHARTAFRNREDPYHCHGFFNDIGFRLLRE